MKDSSPLLRTTGIAIMLFLVLFAPAYAANITWKNAVSGSWHTAANWFPAQVPGPTDVALITVVGNYTVSINSNASVSAVGLSASSGTQRLQVNSGATLTTSSGIGVGATGILILNSGTVAGAGLVDVTGQLTSTGNSAVNSPLDTHAASLVFVDRDSLKVSSSFTNRGQLWMNQAVPTAPAFLFVTGTLTNSATGTLHVLSTARLKKGTLNNQGTIDVDGEFILGDPTVSHSSSGSISVNENASVPGGGLMRVEVGNSGGLSFTASGPVDIGPNSTFSVVGLGSIINQSCSLTGSAITGPGRLFLSNMVCGFTGNPACGEISLSAAYATFPSALVHDTQVLTFNDCTVSGPSLAIAAGRTLTLQGTANSFSMPVITNAGTVQSNGLIYMYGGTWANQSGAHLELGGGLTGAVNLVNDGEVDHGSATGGLQTIQLSGEFTNHYGASLEIVPGAGGTRKLECQLHNEGVVDVLYPTTIERPDADHYNSQIINVAGGDLVISQTGASPSIFHAGGTITVNPGRTLHVSGGSFSFGAGSLGGNGTLVLDNNATANFATSPNLSTLVMSNAVASFPGTFDTQYTELDLSSASLQCDGVINSAGHHIDLDNTILTAPLVNAGTLTSLGNSFLVGVLDNQGVLTAAGAELYLLQAGADHINTGTIQVDSGFFRIDQTGTTPTFTNESLIRVASGAVLRPGGGVFTNDPTGILAGSGIYDMVGTTFLNNGTINPGASPGVMTINGNVQMGPTSVLNMEIGGLSAGSQHDQLTITGTAVIDGILNLSLVNGFVPVPGDAFDLVTYAGHSGTFAALNGVNAGGSNVLALIPEPRNADPMRVTTVGQSWSSLSPSGGPPLARSRHAAAYDPFSNRLIVFGGRGAGGALNDTWILTHANGIGGAPVWQLLSPAGPPPAPRQGHAAAYDATNNRLIVYGGDPGTATAFGDVWVLSNANGLGGTPAWTQLAPGGGTPGPRTGSGVGYNPATNRLILFGGVDPQDSCGFASNDVWVLTNANGLGGAPTWSILATSGLPPYPRSGAVVAYDNASNKLIVQGGKDACAATLGEARYLTGADGTGGTPTWTTADLSAPAPPGRAEHAGIYDAVTDRLVTLAGLDGSGVRSDRIFLVTGATGTAGWSLLPAPPVHPSARFGHSLSWDSARRRMILFGGDAADGLKADVWVLDLDLDAGQVSGVSDPPPSIPTPEGNTARFGFQQSPWPNPSRGSLSFALNFPSDGQASVTVVDVTGRTVKRLVSENVSAGTREFHWDGTGDRGPVSSGVYYIVARTSDGKDMQRVAIVR